MARAAVSAQLDAEWTYDALIRATAIENHSYRVERDRPMRWVLKAAAAKVLSAAPGGGALYYLLQRKVTRSLPPTQTQFEDRVHCAARHVDAYLRASGRRDLSRTVALEFGGGWDLVVPLVFAAGGAPEQYVYDITELARGWLLELAAERVRGLVEDSLELMPMAIDPSRLPNRRPGADRAVRHWLREAGITYRAPADVRATGLPDGSVDLVTNTCTLEHIPLPDVLAIFREVHRVLRPGGVMSSIVDMSDHFSHSDSTITPWHFLRYSESRWRFANSAVLYQNRLRASAYVTAALASGFAVEGAETTLPPLAASLASLPPVHPTAPQPSSREDLLATELHLVCVKPPSG